MADFFGGFGGSLGGGGSLDAARWKSLLYVGNGLEGLILSSALYDLLLPRELLTST